MAMAVVKGGEIRGRMIARIQKESPAFGEIGPDSREGEEKTEDRPAETDQGRQQEAVPEGLALVRIAEDIENVHQAETSALFESPEEKLGKRKKNEERQEGPEDNQADEEGRVAQNFLETTARVGGHRRSRHH